MVNHGMTGYRRGCRCDECYEANREYQREYHRRARRRIGMKQTPNQEGCTIAFDVRALREAIARDGRTTQELSRAIGLYPTTLAHVLAKGTCRDNTLDKIACELGMHMSSLEV